ncbi:MAG: hypothetical protein ACLTYN_13345 [Dysosmobacter welbionis]
MLTNSAPAGDVPLLTKPIGIGVLTTAQKAEMLSVEGGLCRGTDDHPEQAARDAR